MINIGINIFRVISYAFVIIFALGVLNVHFSDKNDYCVMTYMFEYPQFVRISLPENKLYPQYGLYAYSEGRATERTRKMWFDGIPLLFLPGNSGSYMQVRSIASVALRKAYSDEYDSHFDYFTVSYNEELSALYGGVLEKQTKFASACIRKILSLYNSNKYTKSIPTSVILIGHSMGGVVAKRLLVYPSTINSTNIALALAAPLDSPVANVDVAMNNYYMATEYEWHVFKNNYSDTYNKVLLSIGNGARDVLVPSGLTTSSDSYINALTTSIPGVWLSPDHVSIVWCKQLVMTINKYLFSIVDVRTRQITDDPQLLRSRARQYFQANRATTLSTAINRGNVTMLMDAFWYEDNRRMYQISRPGVDRTTYLMVRLVKYPLHRFVAIESVDVDDKEWIFGCNAKYTHNMYRYCQTGTSLSELSRWTGAAADFGKRKLATVDLHSLMLKHPDWTHLIVRVSPTKKPIVLNVDINDYASRRIEVNIDFQTYTKQMVVVQETEPNAVYYELVLRGFNNLHRAFLLYVEPSAGCSAPTYHVSAEMHVPWAENYEYYHYFTQTKRSPMKLRLFKSNPNVTMGLAPMEPVKVTLLLDPQCTFTIKLTTSWYHSLAQLARHYTPVLVPYVCAILLLATRATLLHLKEHNTCISLHTALTSESTRPYYILVFARLTIVVLMSIPMLDFLFYNASSKNLELQYFIRSLLVVPAYMTALGILDIAAAAVLLVMVVSSQIAHRLLFRIMWRGGTGLAERVASGLQKVPMVVSSALICAVPLSCGAASLVAGAAFYGFMLSKMYEEYLEDYVYKLLAKIASRVCGLCKSKDKTERLNKRLAVVEPIAKTSSTPDDVLSENKINGESETCKERVDINEGSIENQSDTKDNDTEIKCKSKTRRSKSADGGDDELNNLNFHMMMFFLWLSVALVNMPALLTWAKSFRYSMVLKPDTSYATGLVMSICSIFVWQMNGPKKKLRYYEAVSALIFTMAGFILILGPLSLHIVNYGTTFIFAVITVQQLCDKEDNLNICVNEIDDSQGSTKTDEKESIEESQKNNEPHQSQSSQKQEGINDSGNDAKDTNDVCDESRIYKMFKNLREKFSFNEDT